jgi:hypothetical protein
MAGYRAILKGNSRWPDALGDSAYGSLPPLRRPLRGDKPRLGENLSILMPETFFHEFPYAMGGWPRRGAEPPKSMTTKIRITNDTSRLPFKEN